MLRWLLSLTAWHTVEDTGAHLYQQNTITGRRRVVRYGRGGYQPVDARWVETGEWYRPPPPGTPVDIGGPSRGVPPSPTPTCGSAAKPPQAARYIDPDKESAAAKLAEERGFAPSAREKIAASAAPPTLKPGDTIHTTPTSSTPPAGLGARLRFLITGKA